MNEDTEKDDIAIMIQQEMDWEIMRSMLKNVNWIEVTMKWNPWMKESEAHMIKEWCRHNLEGSYHGRGETWMFSKESDATLFVLRWS